MIKQSDNLSFLGVQCVYTGMYILVCVVHIYIYIHVSHIISHIRIPVQKGHHIHVMSTFEYMNTCIYIDI